MLVFLLPDRITLDVVVSSSSPVRSPLSLLSLPQALGNMSTISSVTIACLKQLTVVTSSDDLRLYDSEVPQSRWQDELGRLRVWAANIAAYQTGQSSVEHRLRDKSHVKDQIFRVLRRLSRLIQDLQVALRPEDVSKDLSYSDEQGEQSGMQVIYQDIHNTIGELFQLSMIIRK